MLSSELTNKNCDLNIPTFFHDATIGLAPMEGVTDLPARLWYGLASSPSFMWTPFLRVTESYPRTLPATFAPELTILRDQVPYRLVPQVMAANPDALCRVAQLILEVSPFVDINCGCPSPKVVGHGAGSSLLADLQRLRTFTEILVQRLGAEKFSIKTRTGFACESEFSSLLTVFRDLPLHHLTLHGRTRSQRYQGSANWQLIAAAVRALPYLVIGSGDICDTTTSSAAAQLAPVQIIGRGAMANPWLFAQLAGKISGLPSKATIKNALACYAVCNAMYVDAPEALIAIARDGWFAQPLFGDDAGWQQLRENLTKYYLGKIHRPEDLPFGRHNLGRTKMIWNNLRTNLPATYDLRTMLRAASYQEFFGAYTAGALTHS